MVEKDGMSTTTITETVVNIVINDQLGQSKILMFLHHYLYDKHLKQGCR